MSTKGQEKLIQQLKSEEEELILPRFSNKDAIELGWIILNKAEAQGASVTIDIRTPSQTLFHAAMEGTTPNNDRWALRKSNSVLLTHSSSYRLGQENRLKGTSLEERLFISSRDYADHGGSFPLSLEGRGVIGAVTVSGLPQEEDHRLVTESLKELIKSQNQ